MFLNTMKTRYINPSYINYYQRNSGNKKNLHLLKNIHEIHSKMNPPKKPESKPQSHKSSQKTLIEKEVSINSPKTSKQISNITYNLFKNQSNNKNSLKKYLNIQSSSKFTPSSIQNDINLLQPNNDNNNQIQIINRDSSLSRRLDRLSKPVNNDTFNVNDKNEIPFVVKSPEGQEVDDILCNSDEENERNNFINSNSEVYDDKIFKFNESESKDKNYKKNSEKNTMIKEIIQNESEEKLSDMNNNDFCEDDESKLKEISEYIDTEKEGDLMENIEISSFKEDNNNNFEKNNSFQTENDIWNCYKMLVNEHFPKIINGLKNCLNNENHQKIYFFKNKYKDIINEYG